MADAGEPVVFGPQEESSEERLVRLKAERIAAERVAYAKGVKAARGTHSISLFIDAFQKQMETHQRSHELRIFRSPIWAEMFKLQGIKDNPVPVGAILERLSRTDPQCVAIRQAETIEFYGEPTPDELDEANSAEEIERRASRTKYDAAAVEHTLAALDFTSIRRIVRIATSNSFVHLYNPYMRTSPAVRARVLEVLRMYVHANFAAELAYSRSGVDIRSTKVAQDVMRYIMTPFFYSAR